MTLYDLWGKKVDIDIDPNNFPSDAVLNKMDDLLPGAEHGWFKNATGHWLHYRRYLPDGPVAAVCVHQHGICGHSSLAFKLSTGRVTNFALMSREFTRAGYALYTLDMMGHGFSEGTRFFIPGAEWTANRDDLEAFARFAATADGHGAETPLFLMGDSYGGNLALNLSRKWQDEAAVGPGVAEEEEDGASGPAPPPRGFRGFLAIAPAIVGDLPPAPVVFVLRRLLAPLFPTWVPFFIPNPIHSDRIWGDEEVRRLHTDPPDPAAVAAAKIDGSGRPFRLGTAAALLSALEHARERSIPGLSVPFCVCHGTNDGGVPIEGSIMLVERCSTAESDRIFEKFDGMRHDLLSDFDAEKVVQTMVRWISSRLEIAVFPFERN